MTTSRIQALEAAKTLSSLLNGADDAQLRAWVDARMRAGDLDSVLGVWSLEDLDMEEGMSSLEDACSWQSWMLGGTETLAQVFSVPFKCPPGRPGSDFAVDLESPLLQCGVAESGVRLVGFLPSAAWDAIGPGQLRALVLKQLGVQANSRWNVDSALVPFPSGGPGMALMVRLAEVGHQTGTGWHGALDALDSLIRDVDLTPAEAGMRAGHLKS